MKDVGWRGWNGWRWAAAGLAISVSVALLGLPLRAWDLGTAANIAQLLSLLPVAVGVIGWARTRGEVVNPSPDALEALDELVRTIEEKADRVEQSIARQNSLGEGLLEMRDRLTRAATQLATERQALHDQLLEGQSGIGDIPNISEAERERLEAEVARLRRDLQDTQRRLTVAEQLREEVQQRLKESEQQRVQAERLLSEARAQAAEARRHLTNVDTHPVLEAVSHTGRALPIIAETQLMGENDQKAAEEIFHHVDEVFQQEAATLDQVQNDLTITATVTHELIDSNRGDVPEGRRPRSRLLKWRGRALVVSISLLTAGLVLGAIYLIRPLYKISWTYETGNNVASSPAVVDDVVYVGSDDNNVYALNAATGDVRWKRQTGGAISFSSPMVANGVVYIGSQDNKIYALDAATG